MNEDIKQFIREYLNVHKGTGISSLERVLYKNGMLQKINEWCPEIIREYPFGHKVYWYLNDITQFPKCKVCGKDIKSVAKIDGYLRQQQILCSITCNYKYPPNKEERIRRCREKHGVDSVNQLQSKKDQYKKTCMAHFGVPNSMQSKQVFEKLQQTLIDRYGVKTTWKIDGVAEKSEATMMKKYGVKNSQQCKEIHDRTVKTLKQTLKDHRDEILESKRQTSLKHFGTEHPSQCKLVREKTEKTNIEKFGFKTNLLCEETKLKIEQTNLEKYGYTNPNKNEVVKQKLKDTNNERYGGNSPMSDPNVKQKIVDTTMKHYGVPYSLMSEEIKKKSIETCMEKYGVKNSMQSHEVRMKSLSKYTYQNLSFDSAPELALYIYLTDNKIDFEYQPDKVLTYTANDGEHKYFPDFRVENDYWEIKGEHFFENEIMIDPYDRSKDFIALAKFNCMKENGIKIIRESKYFEYIRYVEDKYGKNYLKQFKNCQRPQCG